MLDYRGTHRAIELVCLINKRQLISVEEGSAPKWLLITH